MNKVASELLQKEAKGMNVPKMISTVMRRVIKMAHPMKNV